MRISTNSWYVATSPDEFRTASLPKFHAVLLTGKAAATKEYAKIASTILDENGFALSLQNGLGHEEALEELLGSHRVLGATTTHGAYRRKPGEVVWAGKVIPQSCACVVIKEYKCLCYLQI